MKFDSWLTQNEFIIDWSVFSSPWDAMQLKHNPFREEQVDAIIRASGILEKQSPTVLDLGCGPGILGKYLTRYRPQAQYVGVDGDPLMLSAMRHLLDGTRVSSLQADLRKSEWTESLNGRFDAVVSLTALHWLSQEHQRGTYQTAFELLKPGGRFAVGDPYQPADPREKARLEAIHDEKAAVQKGQTWGDFWKSFFTRYPIEQMYTDYHKEQGYQIPFEGSDDGYLLSDHLETLREVGFVECAVFWKADLRAVYGGKRPSP